MARFAPSTLVWEVMSKADGNPFFLEELAQAVVAQGASQQLRGMPETIEAVLVARLDQLPSEAKRVVQLAAVVGKELPIALLQRLTALPEETMSLTLAQLQMADVLLSRCPRRRKRGLRPRPIPRFAPAPCRSVRAAGRSRLR